MLPTTDYSKLSLEELTAEEQKLKSSKTTTGLFIGILIGIAVYSATHNGFILPIILIVCAFLIGYMNAQNMKSIQAEIKRRGTV
jgi:hypothetical protein